MRNSSRFRREVCDLRVSKGRLVPRDPIVAKCLVVAGRVPAVRGEHRAPGASWCALVRSSEIRHTAFSKLISERSAPRTSPGRAQVSAVNLSAAPSVGQPSKASIERISPPTFCSSVIAAQCSTFGRNSAPRKANVGSLVARSVTIARRKMQPMMPRNRRADSRRPLFSTRFRRSSISAGVMSAIGRSVSGAAKSSRS